MFSFVLLQLVGWSVNSFAIDYDVFKFYILILTIYANHLPSITLGWVHAIKCTVLQTDVSDVACIFKAIQNDTELRLLASDILKIDIANNWVVASHTLLSWLIIEVDTEHGLFADSDSNIADKDVLDNTRTAIIGFDADDTLQMRRIHLAVLDIKVSIATGNL